MNDAVVWIIIIAFYAPLHYLGPLAVAWLSGSETPEQKRKLFKIIFIDCTLSMMIAFGLILALVDDEISWAMGVMLVSLFLPYVHLFVWRARNNKR